jgi:excinuclease ABC subunit A
VAVVVDRLVVRAEDRSRLTDSLETALKAADGMVEVVRHGARAADAAAVLFSEKLACPVCGLSLPELEPRQFSFNSPFGVCPDCHGLGTRRVANGDLVLGDDSISILEGVVLPWGEPSGYLRKVVLPTLAKAYKFDLGSPWGDLPETARHLILHGAPGRTFKFAADGGRGRSDYETEWEGVLRNVERRYRESTSDSVRQSLDEYMVEMPCATCGGRRLRPESLAVLVAGRSIGDVRVCRAAGARAACARLDVAHAGRRRGVGRATRARQRERSVCVHLRASAAHERAFGIRSQRRAVVRLADRGWRQANLFRGRHGRRRLLWRTRCVDRRCPCRAGSNRRLPAEVVHGVGALQSG